MMVSPGAEQIESLKDLGDHIRTKLDNHILDVILERNELAVVTRASSIEKVLLFLRDDSRCLFSQLIDLTAVDYPERSERFEVVYHLLSMRMNQRIRIKLSVQEEDPVPSVVSLFSAAGWFERETWDMFGIIFAGNPDLRRILTDYGFEGHPLRKDFPLTGFKEIRYDESLRRVIYEPVNLVQGFRKFDFSTPWEPMDVQVKRALPGDEKATNESLTEGGA